MSSHSNKQSGYLGMLLSLKKDLQECKKKYMALERKMNQDAKKQKSTKSARESTKGKRSDVEKTLRLYLGMSSVAKTVNANRELKNQAKLREYKKKTNKKETPLSNEKITKNGFRYKVVLRKQ